MDTSKIIIGILIIGGLIIKEILKDVKSRKTQSAPERPIYTPEEIIQVQPVSPKYKTENKPSPAKRSAPPIPIIKEEGARIVADEVEDVATIPSAIENPEIVAQNEAEELERWRRAMIDSEIFKTKF